jgi:hypothetical protein
MVPGRRIFNLPVARFAWPLQGALRPMTSVSLQHLSMRCCCVKDTLVIDLKQENGSVSAVDSALTKAVLIL